MLDIEEGECFEIATDFAGVIDRAGEGPARDEGRAAPAGAPHELEIVRQSAVGISDAAAKREPFGGAQDRFEFQTLDIEPARIHIDVEPAAELGRDLRVLPQIGRASCRERVWQYG